jgi:hypothetical protein
MPRLRANGRERLQTLGALVELDPGCGDEIELTVQLFADLIDGQRVSVPSRDEQHKVTFGIDAVVLDCQASKSIDTSKVAAVRARMLERHVRLALGQSAEGQWAAGRWSSIAKALRRRRVWVRTADLDALPFAVELSRPVLERLAQESEAQG